MDIEQKERIREAMEKWEIFREHGIYKWQDYLQVVNTVRWELGMSTVEGFRSCPDCIINYFKEIYNLWKQ